MKAASTHPSQSRTQRGLVFSELVVKSHDFMYTDVSESDAFYERSIVLWQF